MEEITLTHKQACEGHRHFWGRIVDYIILSRIEDYEEVECYGELLNIIKYSVATEFEMDLCAICYLCHASDSCTDCTERFLRNSCLEPDGVLQAVLDATCYEDFLDACIDIRDIFLKGENCD